MSTIYTFPAKEELAKRERLAPDYMVPNQVPFAAVIESFLSDNECDDILDAIMPITPYEFSICGAQTRECPRPLSRVFNSLCEITGTLNSVFWNYDVNEDPAAWLQTYTEGGDYHLHTDTAPGQMRKLTTVLMLSDSDAYLGGDLELVTPFERFLAPRARGSIITFQPWIPHEVTKVSSGIRQTINLGVWGPNFR